MKLLVGLGNPGGQYETTRHNAGFLMLDLIADDFGLSWSKSKFEGETAKGQILGEAVILLKPTTFMNLSGRAVVKASRFYKVDPEDIIVFHDDIDMESGKVKTRMGGGHGGHNGIRSIIQESGSSQFYRVKLGVGRPEQEQAIDVKNWVLSAYSDAELLSLQKEMLEAVKVRLKGIFQS